jgi:hypothetical protein
MTEDLNTDLLWGSTIESYSIDIERSLWVMRVVVPSVDWDRSFDVRCTGLRMFRFSAASVSEWEYAELTGISVAKQVLDEVHVLAVNMEIWSGTASIEILCDDLHIEAR